MDAKTIKERSKKGYAEKLKKEYEALENLMLEEAKKGSFTLKYLKPLCPETIKILKEEGYIIKDLSSRTKGPKYIISWEK